MDSVMMILEGICPDCNENTVITRVGGTAEFHRNFTFSGDFEMETWARGVTEIGEVEVKCKNGHTNSAFALAGGDWA